MAFESIYFQRRRAAARLTVTRAKAKEALDGLLDRGHALLAIEVKDEEGYEDLRRTVRSLDEANLSALERLFDDTVWAEEYERRTRVESPWERDPAENARFLKSDVKDRLAVIEMTVQALPDTELSPAIAPPSPRVFVVYGHDAEAKSSVDAVSRTCRTRSRCLRRAAHRRAIGDRAAGASRWRRVVCHRGSDA